MKKLRPIFAVIKEKAKDFYTFQVTAKDGKIEDAYLPNILATVVDNQNKLIELAEDYKEFKKVYEKNMNNTSLDIHFPDIREALENLSIREEEEEEEEPTDLEGRLELECNKEEMKVVVEGFEKLEKEQAKVGNIITTDNNVQVAIGTKLPAVELNNEEVIKTKENNL